MPGAGESPSRLTRAFPILSWLPSYQRAWLGRDGVAGLIVICLLATIWLPAVSRPGTFPWPRLLRCRR